MIKLGSVTSGEEESTTDPDEGLGGRRDPGHPWNPDFPQAPAQNWPASALGWAVYGASRANSDQIPTDTQSLALQGSQAGDQTEPRSS